MRKYNCTERYENEHLHVEKDMKMRTCTMRLASIPTQKLLSTVPKNDDEILVVAATIKTDGICVQAKSDELDASGDEQSVRKCRPTHTTQTFMELEFGVK